MINRIWNTKQKGVIEFVFYKDKETSKYIGVCLTFDIIEESDDFIKVMQSVEEAAQLHLKVVIKKKLSDDLLNRYAPEEYWDIYFEIKNLIDQKKLEKRKAEEKVCNFPATLILPYPMNQCVPSGV